MEALEAKYELYTARPNTSQFVGRLLTSAAFSGGIMYFDNFFFKVMFGFLTASVLIPLAKDYWVRQLKSLRLTDDVLEIERGARNEKICINLLEIKKVELVEKFSRKQARQRRKGEVSTTLFEKSPGTDFSHPDTKFVITTKDGERYEIENHYFPEGDFEIFVKTFQQTYTEATGLSAHGNNAQRYRAILTPEEEQIERQIRKNKSFLQNDLDLKISLEDNLIQAYRTIYRVRDAFEISAMPGVKVIYSFRNPDNTTSYIVEKDFLLRLNKDTIETGLNLIDAALKNIRIVDIRIASYKKIDTELENRRFIEESRRKLQGLTKNLKNLQEKNTSKSLDTNLDNTFPDASSNYLSELESLSDQVHDLDDLEKAIMLNQHITLFSKKDTPGSADEKPHSPPPGKGA